MRHILAIAPVFPAACGIVTGILLCAILPLWIAAIVVAAAVVLYKFGWRWTSAGVFFVAVGMILTGLLRHNEPPQGIYGHSAEASATIEKTGDNLATETMIVKVDTVNGSPVAPFILTLSVSDGEIPHARGQRVSFKAVIDSLPPAPLLPGDADFSLYYRAEGIVGRVWCKSEDVRVVSQPSAMTRAFNSARRSMMRALTYAPVSPDCSAFLMASLLGDDTYINPETKSGMRVAGVSHVLAISGLHVGIIVMIVMMLTLPLNVPRWGFYVRPLVTVLLVWTYAMLVDMPPSVVRAAVMTTVYMLARMIQNGHSSLNSLLISIVVVLAFRPMWIYSAGFQLSVAAVASIIAFTSLIPRQWQRHPVRYYLLMSVVIPIAAVLGTGLIVAIHFSTFPLLFLPANLAVGLLIPWILGLGFVVMLFSLAGWQLVVIGWITTRLYSLFVLTVSAIESVPFAQIDGLNVSASVAIPYVAMLALLWNAIRRRSFTYGLSAAVAAALTGIWLIVSTPRAPQAELYILPEKGATHVVAARGKDICIFFPDTAIDRKTYCDIANIRHQGYLSLREAPVSDGLRRFRLAPAPRLFTIGDITMRFICDDADTVPDNVRPKYLVVCKGFRAKIAPVARALQTDTILLSPALHPKIAGRLIAECADSITIRNLREEPLKIIIP